MAHKKYYGYKPKYEHYSVVLHEEGGDRHGEVEHNYIWDEANTKLLMLRTGTKNGKALVNAIYERFHEHQGSADFYIRQWCEKKGIKYEFRAWF